MALGLRVQDFDYAFPPEAVAQTPIRDRDASRLMVVERSDGSISHRFFRDIPDYLAPGDVIVVNDTKVIPARLHGVRPTGGRVEALLLKRVGEDVWECLVRPGHKIGIGDRLDFGKDGVHITGTVEGRTPFGGRTLRFSYDGDWEEILSRVGMAPLPPYIKAPLEDAERYQTMFAKNPGSAAAPTAGLHFTPALVEKMQNMQCSVVPVTLDVGLDTFRPVKAESVEDHVMHRENFAVSQAAADAVNLAKQTGRRVWAVGTTVVRTLESACDDAGVVRAGSASTGLFIYPGFRFKAVDCLVTNFHLPKSSLLMLVSAFAGRETVMKAYEEAVKKKYRLFSFGDAMLII